MAQCTAYSCFTVPVRRTPDDIEPWSQTTAAATLALGMLQHCSGFVDYGRDINLEAPCSGTWAM